MFMELVQIVHVLDVYIVVCSAGRYTGSYSVKFELESPNAFYVLRTFKRCMRPQMLVER